MKLLKRLALVLRSQAVVFTQTLHRNLFNTLILLATLSNATNVHPQSDSKPELFIPMGSYLAHFNIGNLYLNHRSVFLKYRPASLISATTNVNNWLHLSFESNDSFPDAESCWTQGYDLTKGDGTDLACNTTLPARVPIENAARFLYSTVVPYGSYLRSCIGVLQTREADTTFLYASCRKAPTGSACREELEPGCPEKTVNSGLHIDFFKPGRLDITSCQGEVTNNDGALECTGSSVNPRRVLTGSYLESCELSKSDYNVDANRLDTFCGGRPLTLENASNCIGSGKNIAFIDCQLVCQDDPDMEVTEHTASLYLPPGDYLLSCTRPVFYPCMGPEIIRAKTMKTVRTGLLSAQCADQSGAFKEVKLEDTDQECRISELGYVTNINGTLTCDSSVKFDESKYPALGTDLKPHFQCKQ